MIQALTLYELNNQVRCTLEDALDQAYWVQAELSEVNVNRSGHCYIEFVQKESRGYGMIAKARGVIWANIYAMLAPYFESQTGQRFAAGIKVLVQVEVSFHELYGYSLNVVDIDPTFTLGDMALRRREILQALEEQGILTLNQELTLPTLPQRIAVISAPTAAGYGDFCNQLENNPKGYRFNYQLFPAVMQGSQTESSIISALNKIADEQEKWDVVVIIRGGGGTADLASFDTLNLAEHVAQFPLPILTGIGHERDDTVLDLIVHTRVKTPTAAAEFLIAYMDQSSNHLEDLAQQISYLTMQRLGQENQHIERLISRLPLAYQRYCNQEEMRLNLLQQQLHMRWPQYLQRQHARLDLLNQRITDNNPLRLLQRGYSMTLKDDHLVKPEQLQAGDKITTVFAEGQIESIVI